MLKQPTEWLQNKLHEYFTSPIRNKRISEVTAHSSCTVSMRDNYALHCFDETPLIHTFYVFNGKVIKGEIILFSQ